MLGAPIGDLREPKAGRPSSQEFFGSDARNAKTPVWSSGSSDPRDRPRRAHKAAYVAQAMFDRKTVDPLVRETSD
jgi:hypothetical protein